jgi:ligand-binding sensor domain-containing protein
MKLKLVIAFLIVLSILAISCVETKTAEEQTITTATLSEVNTDTLKFISGIRVIFHDSKGDYWFGSNAEGVGHFDGKIVEYFSMKEGLADNQIRSIQEDEHGNIWFETANGINSYDENTIKSYRVNKNLYQVIEWSKTASDLWFNAGTREGVFKYDGQSLTYLAFPNPKGNTSGNVYSLTSLSKGKNNMLWFGTYAGVFGYNGKQFRVINDETLELPEGTGEIHVRSVLEDSKGRLWIGNNGIGVILITNDSIIHFSKEQGKLIPLNEFEDNTLKKQFSKNTGLQSVFAIEEDSEGNIWFGDRDSGAWKYDGKKLTNYQIDPRLSSQMIWEIYLDQNKDLLVGMAEGGIYKFNGKGFDRVF